MNVDDLLGELSSPRAPTASLVAPPSAPPSVPSTNSTIPPTMKPRPPQGGGRGFGGRRNFVKKPSGPTPTPAPTPIGASTNPPGSAPAAWDDWDDDDEPSTFTTYSAPTPVPAPTSVPAVPIIPTVPTPQSSEPSTASSGADELDSLLAELDTHSPTKALASAAPTAPTSTATTIQPLATFSAPLNKPTTGPIAPTNTIVPSLSSTPNPSSQITPSPLVPKQKCKVVCIGGPSFPFGLCTGTFAGKTCARMRCTTCSFIVCAFDGKRWAADADYIFFRNNTPNEQKLSAKIEVDGKKRAYCCQCNWIAAEDITKVQAAKNQGQKELRWVCAGH